MKPITLYWRNQVPNPSKVLVILEELGLPYQTSWVELEDLKREPFLSINPNGKVPAIIDPNTDIKLFESGAIVQYLIDTYDKERRLTYDSFPEKYHLLQWSFFQASGQGPYFGQAAWFNMYHPEKVESALLRYGNELKRIVGVLDRALKDREWLVGDKCTYADLAFVMWNCMIDFFMKDRKEHPDAWDITEFPNFKRWQEAMLARDSLKKVMSVLQDKEVQSNGRI